MKAILSYLLVMIAAAMLLLTACKGNNTGQTGGAQADSGQTNVGSSGATDSAAIGSGAGSPQQGGTSGSDTSSNGKGVATPTVDSTKTNP
ncbi:hypothetical protein DYU05_11280 [Mucilaginibacter terrenus]|uniref:Coproporphyrinogen III oxidase n=1 Tax=Mucilaginibacter terrenus TaxID=2482727 RepID=A0A3E2NP30_9SPHI|nr:hypothetical protein [Mucilaginibacter terrenus]RFZ82748.1 hypothetical protein DYU05_11280 [Mucilaginibacter terrenus]